MIELRIEDKMKHARKALVHIPGAVEKCAVLALNRAVITAKTSAGRAASDVYAVKASEVKRSLWTWNATRGNLWATLGAQSKPWELSKYPHTPKAGGTGGPGKPAVRVQVLRGGWATLSNAYGPFVAPLSGVPKVVIRRFANQLPIKKLMSVNPAIMLRNQRVRETVKAEAWETWHKRMDHEMHRALQREAKR